MKIPFHRVSYGSIYDIKIDNNRFSVDATFSFQPQSSIMLLSHLNIVGKIYTHCNGCGDEVVKQVNESLDFLICNGIYNGFDEEFDIIETLNSSIDLEEILNSELELIISDYYHCDRCDGEYEKEF